MGSYGEMLNELQEVHHLLEQSIQRRDDAKAETEWDFDVQVGLFFRRKLKRELARLAEGLELKLSLQETSTPVDSYLLVTMRGPASSIDVCQDLAMPWLNQLAA